MSLVTMKKKERVHVGKDEALKAVVQDEIKKPIRLNAMIPYKKYIKFKVKCATENVRMSALINDWIDQYLNADISK